MSPSLKTCSHFLSTQLGEKVETWKGGGRVSRSLSETND